MLCFYLPINCPEMNLYSGRDVKIQLLANLLMPLFFIKKRRRKKCQSHYGNLVPILSSVLIFRFVCETTR